MNANWKLIENLITQWHSENCLPNRFNLKNDGELNIWETGHEDKYSNCILFLTDAILNSAIFFL